jgi:hypothetical protein
MNNAVNTIESRMVYVFDHQSGFDWRYSREEIEHEYEEYKNVGWLSDGDGIYSIPVPLFDETDISAYDFEHPVTAYLLDEDWLSKPGCQILWQFSPNIDDPVTETK